MFHRSNSVLERALALDPNLMVAASQLINNRTERGELAKAYADAEALVKRQPESAEAHFSLGYVLRYAGMLEESERECDTALALDPGDYHLRSCAEPFMEMGKTERAMDFLRLDAGSAWAAINTPSILLREGKLAEARESVKKMPAGIWRELLEACLDPRQPGLDGVAHQVEATWLADPDPENRYDMGTLMAMCGLKESALRLLKSSVEHNYCAYSALQADPALVKLRQTPEFLQLLSAAKECQKRFLAERN